MGTLALEAIAKRYGTTTAVEHVDLAVAEGEFVALLGPSGCGKTTTLRMVAGFIAPSEGRVRIAGRDVTASAPHARDTGMVFQSYALFPHMTVAQNVGFGLEMRKVGRAERETRVTEALRLVRLEGLADRLPRQLSGGQQQRVALARALALKPQVLLLDEPLSALDAKIRVSLREEIRSLQRQLGITTIFVTHDQEEALSMSDRIVVMNEGRAEQIGTPFEIYNYPRTRFVASFVGTLNLLPAKVLDAAAGTLEIGGQTVFAAKGIAGAKAGDLRTVALRPEAVALGAGAPGRNVLAGQIEDVGFLGSVVRIRIRAGGTLVSLDMFNNPGAPPPSPGQAAQIGFAREDLLVLDGDAAKG